jgi:hypothetical protein
LCTGKYLAFGFVLMTALSTAAFAQATRTWVSGVGDDANPCSRTAPCKTLPGAISKTAAAGEINILDPGGFGGVTITKSITIYASGVPAGALVSGTNAIIVSNNTGAPMAVTIRGLNIDGLQTGLNGILIQGSSPVTLHVEDTMIYGFGANSGNAINVAPGAAANVTVTNSRISECTGTSSGINADATSGAVNVTLINTEIHGCTTGVNVLGGAKVNARNSDLSQNTTGVMVSGTGSVAFLDSGTIAFCTTGVNAATTGAIVRLTNMTITDNATGLAIATGGTVASFGNNRIKGNTTNGAPNTPVVMN